MIARTLRLQELPGFVAEGDVVGVDTAIARGAQPIIVNPLGWPLPHQLNRHQLNGLDAGPERIGVTDELIPIRGGIALLRPPSLFVGITTEPGCRPEEVEALLTSLLAAAGLSRSSVSFFAVNSGRHAEQAALRSAGHTARLMVAERAAGAVSIAVARRVSPMLCLICKARGSCICSVPDAAVLSAF